MKDGQVRKEGDKKNSPFLSDGLSGRRGYLTLFFPFALRLGGKEEEGGGDVTPSPPLPQSNLSH